jgi:hypothetical protein
MAASMEQEPEGIGDNRANAELQKLLLEIEGLKGRNSWEAKVGRFLPIITALVAIGGFWFTLHQFSMQQEDRENVRAAEQEKAGKDREEREILRDREQRDRNERREQRDKERYEDQKLREIDRDLAMANEMTKSNDAREMEFRRPFWEKQINLYFEASSAVSVMANSTDISEKRKAEEKFWQLFYGPLVIVEDANVEKAMIAISTHLNDCRADPDSCQDYRLKNLSLSLASTCKESIGRSWKIKLEQLKGKYTLVGSSGR